MAGKLYEDLLGIPGGQGQDPAVAQQEFQLELKRKRKIAILRQMLGEDSGLDEVLKGARIVEHKGEQ